MWRRSINLYFSVIITISFIVLFSSGSIINVSAPDTQFGDHFTRGRSNIDIDADGVPDQADAFPNDPAASIDTDNDGHPDDWNSGKTSADSTAGLRLDEDDDNDRMPDAWERKWEQYAISHSYPNKFDPKNASDASEDWDSDGFSNLNEYLRETNPYDSYDHPEISKNNQVNIDDWGQFFILLVITIIAMMTISVIIGIFIIRKRRANDEFWTQTFENQRGSGQGRDLRDSIFRDKFLEWQQRVDGGKSKQRNQYRRNKIEFEIIGGPSESIEDKYKAPLVGGARRSVKKDRRKIDPRFKGRSCIWCDHAITRKYIKRCPGQKGLNNRCRDGPFCSRKCLDEHIKTVPHFQEVDF